MSSLRRRFREAPQRARAALRYRGPLQALHRASVEGILSTIVVGNLVLLPVTHHLDKVLGGSIGLVGYVAGLLSAKGFTAFQEQTSMVRARSVAFAGSAAASELILQIPWIALIPPEPRFGGALLAVVLGAFGPKLRMAPELRPGAHRVTR